MIYITWCLHDSIRIDKNHICFFNRNFLYRIKVLSDLILYVLCENKNDKNVLSGFAAAASLLQ